MHPRIPLCMIDLHVHTSLSGKGMLPATAMRFAKVHGYRAIVFTDNADQSTLAHVLKSLLPIINTYSLHSNIDVYAGVELTHVPPALLPDCIAEARSRGAQLVAVHGQTIADVVEEGTNLAAIEARADILFHPGLLTEQEAQLAAEHDVLLEVSTSPKHAFANGHVVHTARRAGAQMVLGGNVKQTHQFASKDLQTAIAYGAGMTPEELRTARHNAHSRLMQIMHQRSSAL